MRCLIISDAPWATSGYGVQAKALAWTLKSLNHEVAVLAAYGLYGAAQQYDGVTVFPGGMDGFGNDVIGATYRAFNADVLITLKDLWVYRPQEWGEGIRWCPLVPVDHDPIPPGILQIMRGGGVFQPIAYSPFGLAQLENAGFASLYAPHCYDASVYYPMDKAEARSQLGIAAGEFAVGMVAVNRGGVPSRKAWPQNLEGFALFARQYPQAHLYAHTYHGVEGHEQAANLPMICDQVGLRWDYADARQPGSHVTFPNQQAYKSGFPESYMRTFYNAMDLVNTISVGEGFGIPTLEAQACGTPVLVGDWCSSADLLFSGAALPKEDAFRFYDGQGSFIFLPHPKAIGGAMATMLERCQREAGVLRERAGNGAQRYEMRRVREDWRSVMKALEAKISTRHSGVVTIVRPELFGVSSEQDAWAREVA